MEVAWKASLRPIRVGSHVKLHGYQVGIEVWPLDPRLKAFLLRHDGIEHECVVGPVLIYCRRISDLQAYNSPF